MKWIEYFVCVFLLSGIICILLNKKLNKIYVGLLVFFLFKMIFNYRKCTISYLECKIRNVKKEEGFLNNFVDSILNLRETDESIFYYIFAFLIIYYHYIDKNNKIIN